MFPGDVIDGFKHNSSNHGVANVDLNAKTLIIVGSHPERDHLPLGRFLPLCGLGTPSTMVAIG